MNKSMIPDAKYQELSLAFDFEQHPHKLLIKAQSNGRNFQGQIESNPNIDFQELKEMILSKQFKLTQKSTELLKIKLGFLLIELKNPDKIQFNHLQQTIAELTTNLNTQAEKNAQQESTIKLLKKNVDEMTTKLSVIAEQICALMNQSETEKKHLTNELSNLSQKVKVMEQKSEKLQGANKKLEEKVNSLACTVQQQQKRIVAHEQSNHQLINQNNQLHDILQSLQTQSKPQTLPIISPEVSNAQQKVEPIQITNPTQIVKPQSSPKKQQALSDPVPSSPAKSSANHSKTSYEQLHFLSKIVIDPQETNRIHQFFDKEISSIKLLYRASQYEFSTQKFHQKCNNIPNTLILCQTEFNKKIGGFTPLTWQSPENWTRKVDHSATSFIFSLTHNDKFVLKQKEWAIQNSRKGGPTFGYGYGDLSIRDVSNSERVSYSYINKYYENSKYKYENKESFERFNGNPGNSAYFKMVDWEVWELEFA